MTEGPPEPKWLDDHLLIIHEGRVEIANPEKASVFVDADADDMAHLGANDVDKGNKS